jgi:hypothetical protein
MLRQWQGLYLVFAMSQRIPFIDITNIGSRRASRGSKRTNDRLSNTSEGGEFLL